MKTRITSHAKLLLAVSILLIDLPAAAQTIAGVGKYYTDRASVRCEGITSVGNQQAITFLKDKQLVKVDGALNQVWESESLPKNQRFVGGLFTAKESVKALAEDNKGVIWLKQYNLAGQLLADKEVFTPTKKVEYEYTRPFLVSPSGKKSFLLSEKKSSWSLKDFTLYFVQINTENNETFSGEVTIAEKDLYLHSAAVTEDKIYLLFNTSGYFLASPATPRLYMYDLATKSLTKKELGLAKGVYKKLHLKAGKDQLYLAALERAERIVETKKVSLLTLDAATGNIIHNLSIPFDPKADGLEIRSIHYSTSEKAMLVLEPYLEVEGRYQGAPTSYYSKNIYYYITAKDGKLETSGFIPKYQKQFGGSGGSSALSMSYLTVLFFTNSLNIKNLKVARSII